MEGWVDGGCGFTMGIHAGWHLSADGMVQCGYLGRKRYITYDHDHDEMNMI
jgi:hypothetical protein